METADPIRRSIEAVWRIESPRLIASLARIVRDVDLAEDLAQDAWSAALERWPQSGVPHKRGAWLMATAQHRTIDQGSGETFAASFAEDGDLVAFDGTRVKGRRAERAEVELVADRSDSPYAAVHRMAALFAHRENNLDFYGRVEEFHARHLRGRAEPWAKIEGATAEPR